MEAGWSHMVSTQSSIMDQGSPWQTIIGLRCWLRPSLPKRKRLLNFMCIIATGKAKTKRLCFINTAPWPAAFFSIRAGRSEIFTVRTARSGPAKWFAAYLHCPGEEDPCIRSQFFHVEVHYAALVQAYKQGLCCFPQRESSESTEMHEQTTVVVIRLMDDRKSAPRPAFKGTNRPPDSL